MQELHSTMEMTYHAVVCVGGMVEGGESVVGGGGAATGVAADDDFVAGDGATCVANGGWGEEILDKVAWEKALFDGN
jgi:hypothetical protein